MELMFAAAMLILFCALLYTKFIHKEDQESVIDFNRLSMSPEPLTRVMVARDEECPTDILIRLSKDYHHLVRMHVASHPKCPVDILEILSDDNHVMVLSEVAGNENCPIHLLEKLSIQHYNPIRRNVVRNSNCTDALRDNMYRYSYKWNNGIPTTPAN